MYEIIEKVLEGVTWKVRVIVSQSESMFLWFKTEPGQEDVDRVVDRTLTQRLLDNPIVQEVKLSVLPWQFRQALNALGLRQLVEDAVAASGDQTVIDGWQFADKIDRYHPFIVQFGQALGKTEEDMDNLFLLAKTFL